MMTAWKRATFLAILLVGLSTFVTMAAGVNIAERTLPATYTPGTALDVIITVTPDSETTTYSVQDTPPSGWGVTNISSGGTFESGSGRVVWGPFNNDDARTLMYRATPTIGASGAKTFAGTATFNEAGQAITGMSSISSSAAGAGTVTRALPAAYTAGTAFSVSLAVTPGAGTTQYTVIEIVPPAWDVSNVNNSGVFEPILNRITWGPFNGAVGRTLTFQVTPPISASGQRTFSGTGTFNGANVTTGGATTISSTGTGAGGTLTRSLPATYTPLTAVTAVIDVIPNTGTLSYSLQETVPDNWTVNNITQGGSFNPVTDVITWGPFSDDSARSFSFDATPPAGESGTKTFTGFGAFDGSQVATGGSSNIALEGGGGETGTATRSLPADYTPGIPAGVTVSVTPDSSVLSYVVEETPPAGWVVTNISSGGTFNSANDRIDWGPFVDNQPRTLTYSATPPTGETGQKVFSGVVRFNSGTIAIAGDTTINGSSATGSTAVRTLPAAYVPLSGVAVSIAATPGPAVTAWSLDDRLPAGWTAETINEGGIFVPGTRTVQWGPFTDATPRTLTYNANPPANAAGVKTFTGSGEFNGENVAVTGDTTISRAAGGGTATMTLPANYRPLSPVEVSIAVTPNAGTANWTLAETPPAGWTIADINEGGTLASGVITWGPFTDETARTLTFTATPPAGTTGVKTFSGTGTFNGIASAVGGTTSIDAAPVPGTAVRLMPNKYQPLTPVTVTIAVVPGTAITSWTLVENPPADWIISNINEGGTTTGETGPITWGPFTDSTARTLSYQAAAPTGTTGNQIFSGAGTFNGENVTVTGRTLIAEGIPDVEGPAVTNLATLPTRIRSTVDLSLLLTATADDTLAGNSNITAGEYFIGPTDPGQGAATAMAAADGAFNSPTEALSATVDTSTWQIGTQTISVRARDEENNWTTPPATIDVTVVNGVPPAAITNLAATATGGSTALAPIVSDFSGFTPPNTPESVIDGNPTTFWQSGGTSDAQEEFILLELSPVSSVSAVAIAPPKSKTLFPRNFKIQVSADGITYTTVAAAEAFTATRPRFVWQFAPTDAQFVRLVATGVRNPRDRRFYVAINEITVYGSTTGGPTIDLTWTAPAAFDMGPVASYDMRISATDITAANFDTARQLMAPAPGAPGTPETFTITGDDAVGTVFIAIKSIDADGNVSGISNVVSVDNPLLGFTPLTPEDNFTPGATPPEFTFSAPTTTKGIFIVFSTTPTFVTRPITDDEGFVRKTIRFPVRAGRTSFTPSAGQWKSIKKLVPASGAIYWRLEGTDRELGTVFGPARSIFFDTGTITDLLITPSQDVNGIPVIAPDVSTPVTFSWTNNTVGMTFFFVDVSTKPGIPVSDRKSTATFGGRGVTGTSLTLTKPEMKKLLKLATLGGGTLYWHVRATDAERILSTASAPQQFMVNSGIWTVSQLDPLTSDSTPTVTYSTTEPSITRYFLEFSVDDTFRPTAKKTLKVPAAATTDTSITLKASEVARLRRFADANNLGTLFYRVRGETSDKVFVGASPAMTVAVPAS